MLKVVVGGQIDKQRVADLLKTLSNNQFEIDIKSDLDAALAMKSNQYDYYIGACNTGGGGALAMAIALVGADRCSTISMPGNIKSDEFIINEVNSGKVAFGFTAQHAEQVLPVLVNAILNK